MNDFPEGSAESDASFRASSPTELPPAADRTDTEALRRRLGYLMLFRVILITLVLGSTSLLYWLRELDVEASSAVVIHAIIAATYLATLYYTRLLRRPGRIRELISGQLATDLTTAALLVYVTGGAESAYTFFFALAIIGAATVGNRRRVVVVSVFALALLTVTALLAWYGWPAGLAPFQLRGATQTTPLALAEALGLNFAALIAIGALAFNLGSQLESADVSLASERSAAADLLSLHEDIVRSLSSGLVTTDLEHRVLSVNPAAQEILGLSGKRSEALSLEALLPGTSELLDTSDPLARLPRGELLIARPEGTLVIGVSVSPLFNHTDEAVGRVIHFQDLTELRRLEQTMKKAERLAELGSISAAIAHEIRNPLAAVSGAVELLSRSPEPGEDSAALMDIVTREIARLDGLISELLEYANPRPLRRVDVELGDVVKETVDVFGRDPTFADVAIELSVDDGSPLCVHADPEKVRQIVWNLLRNAAEAAGSSGNGEGGRVDVRVVHGDDAAEFVVTDDGPGISPTDLERIFDPFFTTKGDGTGLGLATVQSIVTEHGGDIRVDSKHGTGSSFTVRLPYTGPDAG